MNMYSVHLDTLVTIQDCKFIAVIESQQSTAYEIKSPLKYRGQWIGLIKLALSEISAVMLSFDFR